MSLYPLPFPVYNCTVYKKTALFGRIANENSNYSITDLKKKKSNPNASYLFTWTASNSLCVCFLVGLLPCKASLTHLFNNLCKFNIIWLMISLPNSETIVLNYKTHFNIQFKSLIEPLLFCL